MRGSVERGRASRLALVAATAALGVAMLLGISFLHGGDGRVAPGAVPDGDSASHPAVVLDFAPPDGHDLATLAAEEDDPPSAAASEPVAPVSMERVAVPLGLRGRVFDALTGAPVSGVEVVRNFAGLMEERARSGPDGAFVFPAAARHGTLRASLDGWRFRPERVSLRKLAAEEEVVFQADRIIVAPLQGRLVDEQTGQPVARYKIGVDKWGQEGISVVTDEHGRFETPADVEIGQVSLWLSEASELRTVEHGVEQGPAQEHQLSVRTGPTFFFDLHADVSVSELSVVLLSPAIVPRWSALTDEDDPGLFNLVSDLSSWTTPHGASKLPPEDLRTDGDPAWVRFPPLEPEDWPLPELEGYALLVVDEESNLAGVGHAASLLGIQEQRIAIRLERVCALKGTLFTGDGVPVQNAVVTLRGSGSLPDLSCVTEREGRFGFAAPAGWYEVVAECRSGMVNAKPVLLSEGTTRMKLELQPREVIEIAGTIRSSTGTLDRFPPLELRSREDPGLAFLAEVESTRQRDGVLGSFRFEGVPAGSYELIAEPHQGVIREPSRIPIERSATDLVLFCRDDIEHATLEFVLRAADGEPLEGSSLCAWIEGERWNTASVHIGSASQHTLSVPAGSSVRWLARARGHHPAEGTWRDSESQDRVVDVRLERGAGLVVFAFNPLQNGVEGAEVLLDGVSAGRTNEYGCLALALGDEPRAVHLRKEGWIGLPFIVDMEDGQASFLLLPAADAR